MSSGFWTSRSWPHMSGAKRATQPSQESRSTVNRAKAAKRQKVAPRRRQRQQTGIMRIAAPPVRPWNLNPEEIALVKNHIAKGASDEGLKFCLTVSRRYKLDPFRQQIWFVKRKDNSADAVIRSIQV